MAHDLKGPLREIEGSPHCSKTIPRRGDAETRHHIEVIRRSSLRLTHMIDALLKYSRLEQQDLPRQRFNVLEMITTLITDRFSGVQAKAKIQVALSRSPICMASRSASVRRSPTCSTMPQNFHAGHRCRRLPSAAAGPPRTDSLGAGQRHRL